MKIMRAIQLGLTIVMSHGIQGIVASESNIAARLVALEDKLVNLVDQNESLHKQVDSVRNQNKSLHKQVDSVRNQNESLHKQVDSVRNQNESLHKQYGDNLSSLRDSLSMLEMCVQVDTAMNVVVKAGCQLTLSDGRVHQVNGHLKVIGTHSVEGNVHIHDGSGSVECAADGCSGQGNLIVGHGPEEAAVQHKTMTGSHNIVIGSGHSFSSYGSIVSGSNHTVSAPYASTIAGQNNAALAPGALALGGSLNVAGSNSHGEWTGLNAVVSGGRKNYATGNHATVSGGSGNTAEGPSSTVSGGVINKAQGFYSSVSGGYKNYASAECTSITGGKDKRATIPYSTP